MQTAGAVVLLPFFLPVTLLSRGFHKHTLLSLYILLSLSVSHTHSLSLSQSVFLCESPLSRHGHFLHNASPSALLLQ